MRIYELDENLMKGNKPYLEHQRRQDLRISTAGRRAVEIMTGLERNKMDIKDKTRVARSLTKSSQEEALKTAETEVAAISQQLLEEDRVLCATMIGARLLWSKIPAWLEAGIDGGYTTLCVSESSEILELRGKAR